MYKTTETLRSKLEKAEKRINDLESRNKQLNLLLDERNEEVQAAIQRKKNSLFALPKEVGEWIDSLPLEELFDEWYNNTNELPTEVKEYFEDLKIPGGIHNISDVYTVITERIARSKLDGYLIDEPKKYHLVNKITGDWLGYNETYKCYEEHNPAKENEYDLILEFLDEDVAALDTSSYEREYVE